MPRSTWRFTFRRPGTTVRYVVDAYVEARDAALRQARARLVLVHPAARFRLEHARQLNRKAG